MDVTMPQLGETVTEGTITRWLKKVGERVEVDEPLFEVSTDKVDSEVPAPSAGVVSEILVEEGETAAVGTRLAVLSDGAGDGAMPPATAAAPAPAAPAPAAPAPAAPAAAAPPPGPPQSAPTAPAPAPEAPPPPPAPPAPPLPVPVPVGALPPEEEPDERELPPAAAPTQQPAVAASPPPPAPTGVTSPVVRRLSAEQGLDPSQITGTGEGGRITRRDVLAAAGGQAAAPARAYAPAPAPSTPAAPAAPRPQPPRLQPGAGDQVVPFDNIRRRTAEHMVRSKATSAHVYTSVEVDFERVERTRAAHKEAWKAREAFSLTYLPFIIRAFCDTVDDYPNVNASVDGETLVVHRDIHVGVAVDLDFAGLVAPVIRNADGKRLRLISREIHDLALRARNRQLLPDEVMGGTFTITNPGPYGTFMTLPIINQPQVAILSTDGVKKRPVVVESPDGDATIAIRHVGMLVLTWDHRAFDGAYAAAFLNDLKEVLETRDWDSEIA